MKLTVGDRVKERGFALPTILLVSTVMLTILTASIAAAAASRVSLDSQYYNQLARQAAQSGIARANECLLGNGYTPQWSTVAATRDLRPNSDCTGATMAGGHVSAYVVGTSGTPTVRTKYSIEAPSGSGIGSILRVVGTTELVRTSSPYTVWRTYEQSLYHRIEAPQMVACPEGFASVPGDSRFGTGNFCIGKYEAKNVGGVAASRAEGIPYVNITQEEAALAARNACSGCHLVTEGEWLTVAHNALNVASNWTGDSVGNGQLYLGHSDINPSAKLEASLDDNNGYFGTNNVAGNQRRTLRLNNGEVIWDLAGNVWEWTSGQVAGGKPGPSGLSWREWNAIEGTGSMDPSPFPSYATPAASAWTSSQNIGRVYTNSSDTTLRPIRRGGDLGTGDLSGLFGVYLNSSISSGGDTIGFRIAFVPLSEIACSPGFIPVPGNSMFNTNNFCVGKYEAKNVGGVATSQAAGAPWGAVTQNQAVTYANAACANCRLINEAEWLTIAHNALNVPSNWSTGTVGSGYIYSGHTDNTPASGQAASANDNDGYYLTGNSAGSNQRRTLALSNGEVIWDFSGNMSEWTLGQHTGSGKPGAAGNAWREWNAVPVSGALSPSPFPAFGTSAASAYTSANRIGRLYSNSTDTALRGFLRSSAYNYDTSFPDNAGLFMLYLGLAPGDSAANTSFRMVEVK